MQIQLIVPSKGGDEYVEKGGGAEGYRNEACVLPFCMPTGWLRVAWNGVRYLPGKIGFPSACAARWTMDMTDNRTYRTNSNRWHRSICFLFRRISWIINKISIVTCVLSFVSIQTVLRMFIGMRISFAKIYIALKLKNIFFVVHSN